MDTDTYTISFQDHYGKVSEADLRSQPIKDGGKLSAASGHAAEAAQLAAPYCSEAQTSRASFGISGNAFQIRWQAGLKPNFPPSFVMAHGDRILVEAGVWHLFDAKGELLKTGNCGGSHMVINKKAQSFLYVNTYSKLTGCNLNTGATTFASLLSGGDEYRRTFMTGRDDYMIIVGNERQLDPHMHYIAKESRLSKLDLSQVLGAAPAPGRAAARAAGTLRINSLDVVAAGFKAGIVFALPDTLAIADENLHITAAFSDDFAPLAISTDEAGNIYLLNDNKDGRCLWAITSKGERFCAMQVPGALIHPPIVGYDHRIYVPGAQSITAIDPATKQHSQFALRNKYAGAVVTPDGRLLVADGPELTAFDNAGKPETIFHGTEAFVTPPAITEKGDILVATEKHLLCLEGR